MLPAFITVAAAAAAANCLIYIILAGYTNSVPLSTTTLPKNPTVDQGPQKYGSSQSNDDNIVIDSSSNPFQSGQGDDRFLDYVPPPSTTSLQFPLFGSSTTSLVTPVSNYGDDVFTTAAASAVAGVTATTLNPPWMTIKAFATPLSTTPNFNRVQQSVFSPPWLADNAAGTLVVTITSSEFSLPEPTYNPNNMRTATVDDEGLLIDNNLRTMMAQPTWSPPTNFNAGPTDIKFTLDKMVAHAAGINTATPTTTATTTATPTTTATFGVTSTRTEPLTFFQRQPVEVESLVFREWALD